MNILIVEDHPLLVVGYKSMFKNTLDDCCVAVSHSCEQAYEQLTFGSIKKFDIVFLDWSLPSYESEGLYDGGDLVPIIKGHSPNVKLIILTSHIDSLTLYRIANSSCPNALLCKIDFMPDDFPTVLKNIKLGEAFYSKTVVEQIRKITSRDKFLDNYDRQILALISKGIKTKNLPLYLPLSISAIDKRKAKMKDYFLLAKGNDEDILREAKKNNLI